eukprot:365636-Chlamydomonas_euryale.AAC.12
MAEAATCLHVDGVSQEGVMTLTLTLGCPEQSRGGMFLPALPPMTPRPWPRNQPAVYGGRAVVTMAGAAVGSSRSCHVYGQRVTAPASPWRG